MLNLVPYLVSGLGLLTANDAPLAVRAFALLLLAVAALYGRLLLHGPLDGSTAVAVGA